MIPARRAAVVGLMTVAWLSARRAVMMLLAAVVGVMTVAWLSPGRAVMVLLIVSRVKRWGGDAQGSPKVRQHTLGRAVPVVNEGV